MIKCLYRPFDLRYYYHHSDVVDRPKNEVMQNLFVEHNLGLMFMRQVAIQGNYNHFLVTSKIGDNRAFYSNKGAMQLAPLYIYPDSNQPKELQQAIRPNLSPEFLKDITSKLGYTPTPEAIFYYIYAIFHSPTYRTRYTEFLKIDFPRVPLTSDNQLFTQLATYGEELVALHLMKSPKLNNLITQFQENDGNQIVDAGHPKYTNSAVIINKKGDKFTGIPEQVWNFYVGGYQVCQKWLKDRKGRALTPDDIQHYQRIVVALKETIELMAKIDAVIPAWPIQ